MKFQTGTKLVEEPIFKKPSDVYSSYAEIKRTLEREKVVIVGFRYPEANERAIAFPSGNGSFVFEGKMTDTPRFIVESTTTTLDQVWE